MQTSSVMTIIYTKFVLCGMLKQEQSHKKFNLYSLFLDNSFYSYILLVTIAKILEKIQIKWIRFVVMPSHTLKLYLIVNKSISTD